MIKSITKQQLLLWCKVEEDKELCLLLFCIYVDANKYSLDLRLFVFPGSFFYSLGCT